MCLGSQPQINYNTAGYRQLRQKTNTQNTAIAINQQQYLKSTNIANQESPPAPNNPNNNINSIFQILAANALLTALPTGRTITFNNNTTATNLDLYLTVGGDHPEPLTKITTINYGGPAFVWDIPEEYNWNGNFTTMPAGVSPPQYNAGPTIAEFGLNQVWAGATPDLRDTIDISTVPAGIGTGLNNGPRSAVVAASRKAGFSVQQSYNYNVGVQIVPPVGGPIVLPQAVTVTCTETNGDSADSIGYPNDTAVPKQQTRDAIGNYIVNFLDPVVTVP